MNERIAQALIKQFDRDRIIFWYDSKQELRDDFESLELDRVIKIELKICNQISHLTRAAQTKVFDLSRRRSTYGY